MKKCLICFIIYNIRHNFKGGIVLATWIVHLRIADSFIKDGLIPDAFKAQFIIGSLSPDCGYDKKDSNGEFMPPPRVTHWTPDGDKTFCDSTGFYNTYLKDRTKDASYYFYYGYYIHLITDILWSSCIHLPTKMKYHIEYENDPEYLNLIKQDWYDLDFKFLKENPDFEPYTILCQSKKVEDYLPYYETGQLSKQIQFIADFYKDFKGTNPDREYKFLTPADVDAFISIAFDLIKQKLEI